jgi:hypothetical protein
MRRNPEHWNRRLPGGSGNLNGKLHALVMRLRID